MATQLSDLTTLLNDKRRDTTANSIDMTAAGFRAINSTLDIWNQIHDWPFQVETQTVQYNEGITYYALDTDYKGPIDMRYYKGARKEDFDMVSQNNFDKETLKPRRFTISTVGQSSLLRIKASGLAATINTASDAAANGTWTGSGGTGNIHTDRYESYQQPSSVAFDVTSATAAIIGVSNQTAADLSAYLNRSNIYYNAYLPTITNLTSITLKWGTDSSNYYTASATTDYVGAAFQASVWNKLKFSWVNATTVGTPTASNIKYVTLTYNFGSSTTATGFRIENFFVSENVPIIFEYYGFNMVKSATGTKSQKFTNASNTTDTPLWTGQWDFVSEAFANSVLEILFYETGQYNDMEVAQGKIKDIVTNLRQRLPTRRRYPETKLTFETYGGPPSYYRRGYSNINN